MSAEGAFVSVELKPKSKFSNTSGILMVGGSRKREGKFSALDHIFLNPSEQRGARENLIARTFKWSNVERPCMWK